MYQVAGIHIIRSVRMRHDMDSDNSWWNFIWQQYKTTMLDLDKVNPDWEYATNHGKASAPGVPIYKADGLHDRGGDALAGNQICDCCFNVIHKEPIPLCDNSKELEVLGFGYPLYFIFVKYLIIMLLVHLLSYASIGLVYAADTNYQICSVGGFKHLPYDREGICSSWLIRFVRTDENTTTQEIVLRFTSFALQLALLVYVRDTIRKTRSYYDERNTSISNYSILISRMPPQQGAQARCKQLLEKGMGEPAQKAEQVMLINNVEEFHHHLEAKKELVKQQQQWLQKSDHPEFTQKMNELDLLVKQSQEKLNKEYREGAQRLKNDKEPSEQAIIILSTQDARDLCIERFEELSSQELINVFGPGGQNVEIEVAPEPKQILWENINCPRHQRVLRIVIGWALSIVFIAALTGIFFLLIREKTHLVEEIIHQKNQHLDDPDHQHKLEQQALAITLATLFAVILFNKFIMAWVLHIFTDIEKHRTSTEFEWNFLLKFVMGLFFTTALMTLLVEDVVFHNIYSQEYGVAEEESIVFFLDAFFIPLIWFVHPWWIWRRIQRWYYQGKTHLTQRQANAIMEEPHYSLGKKYAEIIQSFWLTYFYTSLIPGGSLIMFLGLICYYWADKFSLLKRSSIEENVSGQICIKALKLIDFTLVLRSAGEMIFDSQIRMSGVEWVSIVTICIGVVYCLLPMDKILEVMHAEKFKPEQKRFQDAKSHFIENYRTLNPLLAEERRHMIRTLKVSNKVIDFILDKDRKRRESKIYSGGKAHLEGGGLPQTQQDLNRRDDLQRQQKTE